MWTPLSYSPVYTDQPGRRWSALLLILRRVDGLRGGTWLRESYSSYRVRTTEYRRRRKALSFPELIGRLLRDRWLSVGGASNALSNPDQLEGYPGMVVPATMEN